MELIVPLSCDINITSTGSIFIVYLTQRLGHQVIKGLPEDQAAGTVIHMQAPGNGNSEIDDAMIDIGEQVTHIVKRTQKSSVVQSGPGASLVDIPNRKVAEGQRLEFIVFDYSLVESIGKNRWFKVRFAGLPVVLLPFVPGNHKADLCSAEKTQVHRFRLLPA